MKKNRQEILLSWVLHKPLPFSEKSDAVIGQAFAHFYTTLKINRLHQPKSASDSSLHIKQNRKMTER